ncbi:ABC transporter substrate-binding protein [Pseudogulbenkiania sp. MAI-1]|uniref:substrate-binding periplasmic protein n=1 Tax=Pseudogulbenkiania sp. MAI-1 TaxID=990370 RepID=UPI0004B3FA35|nr:ABC transporter substrate-binding protein [Pseudogulbenkiania sp. MAI-1]
MYRHWLAAVALCFPLGVAGEVLTLTTEEAPPFNMVDSRTGVISGIATDKVRELMRRAGETHTLAAYPWSRAYLMAQQDKDTCVFSTTRTPERENRFQWVGPLVRNDWVVFARADDTRRPKTLEELRPYVLGGYRDDAVGVFLKARGFTVDFTSYDAQNVQKLMLKRIDFWATGEPSGQYLIRQNGYRGQIVPLFTFHHTELYLACNPAIDGQRIERLNRLLQVMNQDGSSAAIERRYQ